MVMDESRSATEPDAAIKGIDTVVCLHGIWAHGAGMYLIKRHLEREYGMRGFLFSYPSVSGSLDENAALLAKFIGEQGLESAHLVGHSLGGVIALRMLANHPDAVPGRVVCVGSPLTGSRAAEIISRVGWGEAILGNSLPPGVLHEAANLWATGVCHRRDVGIIAGSIPIGIGHVTGRFGGPNDGTVAVAETELDGARDHIVLPVSHTGMMISRKVADQAGAFLRRGSFLRDDDSQ